MGLSLKHTYQTRYRQQKNTCLDNASPSKSACKGKDGMQKPNTQEDNISDLGDIDAEGKNRHPLADLGLLIFLYILFCCPGLFVGKAEDLDKFTQYLSKKQVEV
jgi:hypothetical protein